VITVGGEVDACNAERVSDYVVGFVHVDHPLVLDLGGVEFLGVAGFRAIIRFAAECRRAEREWALVTSDAVNLLLGLTESHYLPPAVGSVDELLQQLAALPNAARRFGSVTRPECMQS
jgi:anti-anti-sigma factor